MKPTISEVNLSKLAGTDILFIPACFHIDIIVGTKHYLNFDGGENIFRARF